ncbi:MAG: radical SAM protein [Eubacteriales bacterium]|nr:radical SAM protein [Eubacteriales bacterium]
MAKTIAEFSKAIVLRRVLRYVNKDFDKNGIKVINWLIRHDRGGGVKHEAQLVKEALSDPGNNWSQLLRSLWTDIDDGQRLRLFENFVVNGSMIGTPRQRRFSEKYDCNIPWAVLMDPTSACNLHCTGCWAAEYGDKLSLSLKELDGIVRQAKVLGTYFFIYSGGEPLVRKKDIITLCERHPDCAFLSFTNGTLIDEAFADEMLRVKNFVPAISVEGFEEATDSRRGKGTYAKVVQAMEILKRKKLAFGISCCYTSQNTETIGSEAYLDEMIRLGAKFMWLFTYIPVGKDAVPELMVTAEQREFMYHQLRAFRDTKAIFTMDFWNDGEYADGCIAGGRRFLHINANGDIEPCAFIHYSDSNIRTHTLLEAYQRPLFMQYRKNQPFNDNMLMPCPLLDNSGKLAEMIEQSGATSTDLQNPEDVHTLCDKCNHAAACWTPVADRLWVASDGPARWEHKKLRNAQLQRKYAREAHARVDTPPRSTL